MNLKKWRISKGYTLQQIAKIFNKKSAATIHNWEKEGINSLKIIEKLKMLSDGQITDFKGEGVK